MKIKTFTRELSTVTTQMLREMIGIFSFYFAIQISKSQKSLGMPNHRTFALRVIFISHYDKV